SFFHLNSDFSKLFPDDRHQLRKDRTAVVSLKFKREFDSVFVPYAVTIMIDPTGLFQKLYGALWVVRPGLDVRIELFRSGIKVRGRYAPKTETNRLDHLLPVHQHRHRLTYTLVFEKRAVLIPTNVVVARNGVFCLNELLIERCAAGLLRVLNWQQSRLQVNFAGFQCC